MMKTRWMVIAVGAAAIALTVGGGPAAAAGGQPWPGALNGTAAVTLATLTFDELPFQPVNGVVISGVHFFFYKANGNDWNDAFYNAGGPGCLVFVCTPVLEGNDEGTLAMHFDTPASFVRFGIARDCDFNPFPDPCIASYTVKLYNKDGVLIQTKTKNTFPRFFGDFSEGRFKYQTDVLTHFAQRVVITFGTNPAPIAGGRFALDNLLLKH